MGFSLILQAFFSFPNERQFIECQFFWKFRMKVQDILFEQMYRNNEARLNRLKNNLEREDSESEWALCLGAGISISAGLPDWYGLLAKMTAQIIPDEMMFELQNNTRACQLDASGYDRTESDPKTDDEAFQVDVQRFFEELNAAAAGIWHPTHLCVPSPSAYGLSRRSRPARFPPGSLPSLPLL